MRLSLSASVLALALVWPAAAGDRRLLAVIDREVPRLGAGHAGPDTAQTRYDTARDLQEALRRVAPVSRSCGPLLSAARLLARGEILHTEGIDRLDPHVSLRGLRLTRLGRGRVEQERRACRPSTAPDAPPRVRELDQPRSNEAFFGLISDRAPLRATSAEVRLTGRDAVRVAVRRGALTHRMRAPPGRYAVRVAYLDERGRALGHATSRAVWLLPRSAARVAAPARRDETLSRRLRQLAATFPGHSAMWLHDLASGNTAESNADARFPAASTVKLAVLIAALRRFAPAPERSRVAYDLNAMTGWSSNLASNRLLREIGGTAVAQAVLDRAGASSSTFTGDYRIGTSAAGSGQPPAISSRVTTARDLGRILFHIHAASLGGRRATEATGLTSHEARVALQLLLSSQSSGDNTGLFRPSLPPRFPLAQKHGWFSAVRHTAAILYGAQGPRIAVLLTYRPGITRRDAAELGARFLRVVRAT